MTGTGGLSNTGQINIEGSATVQSTLNITDGVAGFGTAGVETGTVFLKTTRCWNSTAARSPRSMARSELNGANARVADAGKPTTNSALTGSDRRCR